MKPYPNSLRRNRDMSPMTLSVCRRIGIKTSEEFWDTYIAPPLMRKTNDLILGKRFGEAVEFASERHGDQLRKGTTIPYMTHLLAVASLAIEDAVVDKGLRPSLEEIAVAALLHDLIEDTGTTAAEIESYFGPEVARIVVACSDRESGQTEAWDVRKARYLAHLEEVDDAVLCVSLADKRHNARCIVDDLRVAGAAGKVQQFWERFNAGPGKQADQYRALANVFVRRRPGAAAADLLATVDELAALVSETG